LEPPVNNLHVGGEVSALVQHVVPDGATMDDVNNSLIVREEGMQHSNPRIQQDLDLWQRLKIMISVQQTIRLSPYYPKSKNKC